VGFRAWKYENPQCEACATKTEINRSILSLEKQAFARLLPFWREIWPNYMNASPTPSGDSSVAADAVLMDRALALAARGVALTSPNPLVGSVLVRDGHIIAEGFHTYEGVRHAEIIALESAGESARGATLYINLEPCCHTGRTGPCTQALIAARVARVVAAMADPNPAVAGRGFQQLRAAGIEVSTGLREAEARRLNEAFARWIVSHKPLVTLKSALTLDGHLVLPPAKRGASKRARISQNDRWISSPESRAEVQQMRHASDALLTGIGTVLIDDPLLTDRTGLPRRRKLLRVVMDSRLRLPLRSKLVRSADNDLLVFTRAKENSPKARALRRAGVEVMHLAGRASKPNLDETVTELGRREILSVLLEAGEILNSAALAAGIVDKMRMFIAPKVAGGAGSNPGKVSVPARPEATWDLQKVTIEPFGPDFAIGGYLRDVYRTR
jgi:diaminohydroxyphosphoribosylaminopyrimidine deaminase/5-amino-6-(5-phosphoribosylamino)uracil reductase